MLTQNVNDADKVGFRTHRESHHYRTSPQAVNDGLDRKVEVRAQLVHLVDEADTRHVVLVSLAPHGFGLRFHAFLTVKHRYRTVKDAQGTFHLNGEVHVSGSVDDVNLIVVPKTGRGRGGNGDTAFLFLFHPVHSRSAIVRFTDLVVNTGVEQDAFRRGRLTSIDVCHDANVADLFEVS